MSIQPFIDIFKAKGINIAVNGDKLEIESDGSKFYCPLDEVWNTNITSFFKAKQYEFNANSVMLSAYRSVEFQIVRVDSNSFFSLQQEPSEFEDKQGNKVILDKATPEFALALLDRGDNKTVDNIINIIKRRLKLRVVRGFRRDKRDERSRVNFQNLLFMPYTARYVVSKKTKKENLLKQGRSRIKACLFKIAYLDDGCWKLKENIKSIPQQVVPIKNNTDSTIPQAVYIEELVDFYKVARSSQFPSQTFLAFYHILEHHFLVVSDEIIYKDVRSHINSLAFNTNDKNINKLLSIVKKNEKYLDETGMLKAVLNKYVNEEDMMKFVRSLEKDDKKYSGTKIFVFGERGTIELKKGHALSNTAKVIKHIRNSLVHSSDTHNRAECFLHFSEEESIVRKYIPIVKYLAEQVIFATATHLI